MSRLAIITFLSPQGGDIDNSLPGAPVYPSGGPVLPGGPVDPGYGRPSWGGRPDNSLPGGGHIVTLPVFPFDPTVPSNELPGEQPEAGNDLPRPGKKYVVKWLACHGLILVPDNTLPESGGAQPK